MKACQYRVALEDGRIICEKISEGNPEVGPNICGRCPVMGVNCEHLRFTLRKIGHTPIVVRYSNGRSEVWDENPPAVEFIHGACAEKVMPISGPQDCVGCQVRCPARREASHTIPTIVRDPIVADNGNVILFPTTSVHQARNAGYERAAQVASGQE